MDDVVERVRAMSVSQANSVDVGSWDVAKLLDEAADTIDTERALTDDLADALNLCDPKHVGYGWSEKAEQALARYQEMRQR